MSITDEIKAQKIEECFFYQLFFLQPDEDEEPVEQGQEASDLDLLNLNSGRSAESDLLGLGSSNGDEDSSLLGSNSQQNQRDKDVANLLGL